MYKIRSDGKIVETNISIQMTISYIKKIVDLTDLNPEELDKMKMAHVIYRVQENNTLCFPFETRYYVLKVIQYVRNKSESWAVKLSDAFIKIELNELVYQLKIDRIKYSIIGRIVNEWMESLKMLPVTNFRYIFPINNVDYRRDFNFKTIKLKKLTALKLKRLMPSSPQSGFFSPKELTEGLISDNETEIFGIVDIQAKDQEQGMILANLNLSRLIHAMRLFDPLSGITERTNFFPPETIYYYLMIDLDNLWLDNPINKPHLNAHVWRSAEYWRRIAPDWTKLQSFLFSDNPNQLQSTILAALYWYGDAGKPTENHLSKFLKYVYGLENLVIFDNEYDKKNRMASRLAPLLNKIHHQNNQEFYSKLLKKYYDLRNLAIHAGKFHIDEEVVTTTHEFLRDLIFEYIRLSKKYTDVQTMLDREYAITI